MKRMKFFVVGLLIVLGGLSFMSRNNFNPDGFEFFDQEEPMVSVKDFKEFINTEIIRPISVCYTKAYPHAFMSKCYSNIHFSFGQDLVEIGDDHLLYANYPTGGNIVFKDCGQEHHVCAISVTYATKEIKVQESFLSEWVSKEVYLESFCKKMDEVKAAQE